MPADVDRSLASFGLSLEEAPGSWVGAPIVAAGKIIGAVSLSARTPSRYGERDLQIVQAVAGQAAIALVNARLLWMLSAGKRQWEQTVDAIGQAFCVIDSTETIRRANRAFGRIVDSPLTALAGRPWAELLPTAGAGAVANALASIDAGESFEIEAGGRLLFVSALTIGDEDEAGAVLVFEDQTEKRRLQDQLIQSEKMSAMGQLIAGVAHDLNNPLASVVGFADYLVEREDNAPDDLIEPLRAIRQEAERAASIVRNLLTFARKQERQRRTQPIGPILEATLFLLRNQLMACKVDVTLSVDSDLPAITVDSNQLQQVFVNLTNNAAQAMQSTGAGGRITVSRTRWLDGVAITIEDDGPGVPDDLAERIFEPFFTTKSEGEGTGLGLSICQGIVKEHGGRIALARGASGGAAFRVELPGGAQIEPAQRTEPSAPRKLRILVVDDEPHILHYMRATLDSWGHDVVVEADGAGALERIESQPFDVVISDLRMPGGGRELYETLKERNPAAVSRVVFSTGDTVRGDTLTFLESLGRPYLRKPFTLAELRAALGAALAAADGP